MGLVDSGADLTCLDLGFAALMGYTGQDLEEEQGVQAGGTMQLWKAKQPSRAIIVGLPQPVFDLWPTFVQGNQTPLWGRADFFRAFGIGFDESNQRFSLSVP